MTSARIFLSLIFPSWKFFETSGHMPRLAYRTGDSEDLLGKWQNFPPTLAAAKPHHLFFNPQINFAHAVNNQLAQLMQELETIESQTVESLPSFKIVVAWLKIHVQTQTSARAFQFEIRALNQNSNLASFPSLVSEPVLISRVFEVNQS